jgi:hypothetical protein
MVQLKNKSAGLSASDAGTVTNPIVTSLSSAPAVVIGTSQKGPAFVPMTFTNVKDFTNRFGDPYVTGSTTIPQDRFTNYAPFAVQEWLKNSSAVTFVRVLGVGDGKRRVESGLNTGDVVNAGFTVGEKQPDHESLSGSLGPNPYANLNGIPGRTYFLGCFMSESLDSTVFSSAGLQGTGSVNGIVSSAVPIIRGILMAPSGVVLKLSSSGGGFDSEKPSSTLIANDFSSKGTTLGSVNLFDVETGQRLQQFVMLLNGHKGSTEYPSVITASFDMQSPNYITKVFNLTASLMQHAGHYLTAHWDIHPSVANLTGAGVVLNGAGSPTTSARSYSTERSAFIITSSLSRDTGSSTVPNYEAFRDRFSNASTPWIISQKIQGKSINLFKLHALDAGTDVSNKYKIIVDNITPPELDETYKYSTFNLTIRPIEDFVETTTSLETFVNLNLDPSSDNYISKIIGDKHYYFDFDRPENNQKLVIDGNYDNSSRYVRVEVSQDVHDKVISRDIIPVGFRGMAHLITSGSSPLARLNSADTSSLQMSKTDILMNTVTPPIPLADNIAVFTNNNNSTPSNARRWGIKFDHVSNLQKQNQVPVFNRSIDGFLKYFPNNSVNNVNFSVSDNSGAPDTNQLGIIDCDRFCNNIFSLENIKVFTDSNNKIPTEKWALARYVRNGIISKNSVENSRPVERGDFNLSNNSFLSFQLTLQGGFDGVNIFEKNEYNLSNAASTADMLDLNRGRSSGATAGAYLSALKMVEDVSALDMQLLAIPGIRTPAITDQAANVVENRFDALYIMDIEQVNQDDDLIDISIPQQYSNSLLPSTQKTVDRFTERTINNSFAAAYYPDVVLQVDINKYTILSDQFPPKQTTSATVVPPSVVVLGAISLNDSLGQTWFAPAGINRGALKSTIETTVKLKEPDLNLLYSGSINPLWAPKNVRGQSTGTVIWGQKTLASINSSLNRINVRRLLLEIRRKARDIAIGLLFESGKDVVISRFKSQMGSELTRIQSLFGLQNYKIDIDSSSTTKTDIENNTIRGRIYVQPPKTQEFVSLDFIVSNKNSEV